MTAPLISAAELRGRLASGEPPPVLLDVRWELATGAQRDAFQAAHIPGAAFVDLGRDLAGEPGAGGRHPLPAANAFESAMRRAGVRSDRSVVVYDAGGGLSAARAWWLLRYFGHPAVALLDGGLAAWTAAGGAVVGGAVVDGAVVDGAAAGGSEPPHPGAFVARPGGMPVLDAAAALSLARRGGVLLDARAPERFRGEIEPIDPVAGHIPGARNRPTTENLDATGRFRETGELAAAFAGLGAAPGADVGSYCGSGVTAAHQVLALELAGVRAALYPGSWSEWVADPGRPVTTGSDR